VGKKENGEMKIMAKYMIPIRRYEWMTLRCECEERRRKIGKNDDQILITVLELNWGIIRKKNQYG